MIWDEHTWVIPFPGEFHFLVHITHAMFHLFENILIPFANFLGREKITVDFLSKYWHKQEDFMEMVIEGIMKWLQQVKDLPSDISAAQVLSDLANNKTVYNLVYFVLQFGIFYWNLRQEIRKGNVEAVCYGWRYAWPLFHVTNKYHYEKLCLITTYCEHFTHPAIQECLQRRLCNLKGIPGHHIGTDMVTEKECGSVMRNCLIFGKKFGNWIWRII